MKGDFIQKEDTRPISGYGSALLVDEYGDGYFSLVIPLESIPSVYGDTDIFDYDLLTAISKGKVKGKQDLTAITTDILYTRENIYRLEQLENRQLTYMVFHQNGTGYTFTGEVSLRENDTEAEILRGTLQITPIAVHDRFMDGRKLIRKTLDFAGNLPDSIVFDGDYKTQDIEVAVKQADASESFDVVVVGDTDSFSATYAGGKVTIKTTATKTAYAIVYITAKSTVKMDYDTQADKYAPWTMTIALSYIPDTTE